MLPEERSWGCRVSAERGTTRGVRSRKGLTEHLGDAPRPTCQERLASVNVPWDLKRHP